MHSFEFQEHTEWFLPKTQNLKKKDRNTYRGFWKMEILFP